jgi:putative serine protease PepD
VTEVQPRSVGRCGPRSQWARAGAVLAAVVALAGCGGSSHSRQIRGAPATQTASSAQSGADALQQQFVEVVKAVEPEVVQIQTNTGLGSGIVVDDRADVVTNAHVVTGAEKLMVTLATGRQHPATLVGIDPQSDVAVIQISGATPRPATFADSSTIHVGDIVLAIGNPLGLRSSVTQGIVSSVGRTVSEGNGVVLPSVIQTSAEINPGNSGGALVDLRGDVVGIPTLAAIDPESPGGAQAPGIGFAIPSNTAKSIATKLIQSGSVATAGRAYLGVVVSSGVVGGGSSSASTPAARPPRPGSSRAISSSPSPASRSTRPTCSSTSWRVSGRARPCRFRS